jgi:hypothetical protein
MNAFCERLGAYVSHHPSSHGGGFYASPGFGRVAGTGTWRVRTLPAAELMHVLASELRAATPVPSLVYVLLAHCYL